MAQKLMRNPWALNASMMPDPNSLDDVLAQDDQPVQGPMPASVPAAPAPRALHPLLSASALPNPGGANAASGKIGSRQSAEQEAKQDQRDVVMRILHMEPEEYKALTDTVMQSAPIQQQLQGVDKMQDLLKARLSHTPVQFDLSPLAAYADAQTGSHMAESYKQPNYGADADKILGYANDLQKQRGDIMKEVTSGINSMKAGTTNSLLQQMLAEKLLNEQNNKPPHVAALNPSSNLQRFLGVAKGQLQPLQENMGKVAQAMSELASNNGVANNNLPIMLGNLAMSGVAGAHSQRLALETIGRETGDPAYAARMEQWFTKAKNGKLTPQNKTEYGQFVGDIKKLSDYVVNKKLSYLRQLGQGPSWGIPLSDINNGLGALYVDPMGGFEAPKSMQDRIVEAIRANRANKGGK